MREEWYSKAVLSIREYRSRRGSDSELGLLDDMMSRHFYLDKTSIDYLKKSLHTVSENLQRKPEGTSSRSIVASEETRISTNVNFLFQLVSFYAQSGSSYYRSSPSTCRSSVHPRPRHLPHPRSLIPKPTSRSLLAREGRWPLGMEEEAWSSWQQTTWMGLVLLGESYSSTTKA
jgi:hypothetical protein